MFIESLFISTLTIGAYDVTKDSKYKNAAETTTRITYNQSGIQNKAQEIQKQHKYINIAPIAYGISKKQIRTRIDNFNLQYRNNEGSIVYTWRF